MTGIGSPELADAAPSQSSTTRWGTVVTTDGRGAVDSPRSYPRNRKPPTLAGRGVISWAWTLAGLVCAAYAWWLFVTIPHYNDAVPHFAAGNWQPYTVHLKTQGGAFIYSPAYQQVLEPLRQTGLTAAGWYAISVAACLGVLAWLSGPLLIPVLFLALNELEYGNINLPLLAAVLLSFRFPWTWAFVLLTKVTPGVGLLWFVFRGEWRQAATALWSTIAVVAVSFVLDPHLWFQWRDVLLNNAATAQPAAYLPIPLWARLAACVALVAWAAPRNYRWAVPVAFVLATPWLHPNHLILLVGVLPFVRRVQMPAMVRRYTLRSAAVSVP